MLIYTMVNKVCPDVISNKPIELEYQLNNFDWADRVLNTEIAKTFKREENGKGLMLRGRSYSNIRN